VGKLEELKAAIRQRQGCDSRFVETVLVRESIPSGASWEGDVAIFDLLGHPTAKRCYAWCEPVGEEAVSRLIFQVIDIPPVESAETAIRFALAAHERKAASGNSPSNSRSAK